MNGIKTRHLTIDAMLAALCAVLGYVSLDLGNLKLTFESLPILLGALLFGPVDGLAIGGVGTLLYQFLRYGISATTLLWVLPYALCGLIVGWRALRRGFRLTQRQILALVVAGELLITTLNTGVLYIDSRIYGYYTPAFLFGSLALRLLLCVVKACAFGAVLPGLSGAVRRALRLHLPAHGGV